MQSSSPPPSPSFCTSASQSVGVQTATPPASSPASPQSPSPTPAALEPPVRDEDGSRLLRWGPWVVLAGLGLGGAFLLNRLRPPASLRQSLWRYALYQLPGVVYITCNYALDRAFETAEAIVRDTEFNPTGVTRVSAFQQTDEQEQARRRRLGIADHQNLPAAYIAAWLNNGTEGTHFGDASVQAAALAADSPHSVVGLVTACREFRWYSHPLPGSRACHTHDPDYGTATAAPRVGFHLLTRQLNEPGSLLPLDQLRCGEVLVLMMAVPGEGGEAWVMTAIQRRPGNFFLLFDPAQGLFFIARPQLLQDAVRPDAFSNRASRLELIRLRQH